MSRIGKMPIAVPAGVEVKIDGTTVTVKGPKGTLTETFNSILSIEFDGTTINVTRPNDESATKALHGLTRTLVHNMVTGVTEGFKKELQICGVGYRCAKTGKDVNLTIGYSHPVIVSDTDDCTLEVTGPNNIIVHGIDKQKVGQYAAEIRGKRPPEPYKGKGIKYIDEIVRRKEGKAAKGKK